MGTGCYNFPNKPKCAHSRGVSFGIVEFYGKGIENRDLGFFLTVKEEMEHSLGISKASVGVTSTVGCRENFYGVGADVSFGMGGFGVSAGPNNQGRAQSTGVEIGMSVGIQGAFSKTWSWTIGDAVRFIAKSRHGDGGLLRKNGECGCN